MRLFAILILLLTTLNTNAQNITLRVLGKATYACLLYTSPSPRDRG